MDPTAVAHRTTSGRRALVGAAVALLAAGAFPLHAAAAPALERIVVREHNYTYSEHVTDDACGETSGGLGLRSGTFINVENGHTTIWVYEDKFVLVDVETGTYTYDFDDPSIPDVVGVRYTSPTKFVFTKSGNEAFTLNQVEFLPGAPDGIRIQERINVQWRDGLPFIERVFFVVTGCP